MSFRIGEHKADIATLAGGAALGSVVGNAVYSVSPDRLATYTLDNGREIPHITNKFIRYAQKVSEKDLMGHIDPHTNRSWVNKTLLTIRNRAAKARSDIMGDERWEFQKIYKLGVKYLTKREEVPELDLGLAKRGANAIIYGQKMERRKSTAAGALIGAAAALLIKFGITEYKEYKDRKRPNNQIF